MHLGAIQIGVLGCAAALFVSTLASSEPLSEALNVVGKGVCPPPEAVRNAIFQLTSDERRRALPPNARVTITDEGQKYRVTVTSEGTSAEKNYTDPERDCTRRTRFAAVFAILALMPPELGDDGSSAEPESKAEPAPPPAIGREIAPPSSTQPPARSRPAPEDSQTGEGDASHGDEEDHGTATVIDPALRARRLVRLELVGLGETALGAFNEPRGQSLGGELRAELTPFTLAPLLTVGFSPSRRLEAGRAEVEVQRLQFGLGLRARSALGPLDVGADLNVLVALERIEGIGLEQPARSNALELGARAAVLLSLDSRRVGPLVALHASVFPAPNEFEALPRGGVGHMPHVWLGAALGGFLEL